MSLAAIPDTPEAVIGMMHLRALPGSPYWAGGMQAVIQAALEDARALAEGGADALLVENYGDANPVDPRRVRRLVQAAHA